MKNHAMADALQGAGYDTARDEFHVACVYALRRTDMSAPRAADVVRDALIKYLVAVARDMNGTPLGGGQSPVDTQHHAAPAERSTDSGGRGHPSCDARRRTAPTSATLRGGDKGHSEIDVQLLDAPPPQHHRDGTGHLGLDTQTKRARPAREPSVPKRSLAAMGKAAKVLYAADFYVGAVKMPVGEVRVSSYERLIFTAGREKVLGRCLKAYVSRQAHVPKDAKTRDIVPEELTCRMIAFSKHSSLHGIEYMNDTALLEQREAFYVKCRLPGRL